MWLQSQDFYVAMSTLTSVKTKLNKVIHTLFIYLTILTE